MVKFKLEPFVLETHCINMSLLVCKPRVTFSSTCCDKRAIFETTDYKKFLGQQSWKRGEGKRGKRAKGTADHERNNFSLKNCASIIL